MSDDKKDDVVKGDDYNKVVEAHNSQKTENERLKKELEELKAKQVEEAKKVEQAEKNKWKEEAEAKEKQIAELKEKLEAKKAEDNSKVAKGVVSESRKDVTPEGNAERIKKLLDEKFPLRKTKPENFGSAMERYAFYKRPSTRHYSKEQLGEVLSLHASAQKVAPEIIDPYAKTTSNDIKL